MLPFLIVGGAVLTTFVPVRKVAAVVIGGQLLKGVKSNYQNDVYERYAKMRINPEKLKRDKEFGTYSGHKLIIWDEKELPEHAKWVAGEYFLDDEEEAQLDMAIQLVIDRKTGGGIDISDMKIRSEERIKDPMFSSVYKEMKAQAG